MNTCVETEDRSANSALPATMKAVTYDRYGDAGVLHYGEIATPSLDPRKVTIQVHAASVNPIDYRLRRGDAKWLMPGGFPRVPGYDVAGIVVATPDEALVNVGDRVIAFLDNWHGGAYAQYVHCGPHCLTKIDDDLSWHEAAAIPLAGTTTIQCLRDHGSVKRGDRVLINGASGGVGAFAVQIAKSLGADVTAVASGRNEAFVLSLGADGFIDYQQADFEKSDDHWDVVFDAVGKSSYRRCTRVMSPRGRYVSTEPSVAGYLTNVLTLLAEKRGRVMLAKPNSHDLHELVLLHRKGQLNVTIDQVFPLCDAREAHSRIETGVDRGKIVLHVAD
jgi:NADPH2:quinone reductase